MCFCVRELLAFVLRMLEKQQHINKPLASVSHSQVKLALNAVLHVAASSWIFIQFDASFVDHESNVSCISIGLHRLPDRGKTNLHHLGAWKCVRNGEQTNPWIGTISRTCNCSEWNDYASRFVPAERIHGRKNPLSHWIHCHELWGG